MSHARVDGVRAHDGAPPTLRTEHTDLSLQHHGSRWRSNNPYIGNCIFVWTLVKALLVYMDYQKYIRRVFHLVIRLITMWLNIWFCIWF